MPNTTNRNKRIIGAVASAAVMGGLMLLLGVCVLLDYFGAGGSGPELALVLVSALICLVVAVGVAEALLQRIREVKRGEEDEARKY